MRALVLADIDDFRWHHGPGEADVILSLGDVADCLILEAREAFGSPPVFAVKGNHDAAGPFPSGITDLHLKTTQVGGMTFGGFNGCWRYKLRGHFLYEQDEVAALLKDFPRVDVFVAHNSPSVHANDTDVHVGFRAFDAYIRDKQPRIFLHGHQHINRETIVGATEVVGVHGYSVLNLSSSVCTSPD